MGPHKILGTRDFMSCRPRALSSLIALALLGAAPTAFAQQAPPYPQARNGDRDQPPPWMQPPPPAGNEEFLRRQQRRDSASDAVRRIERDTRGEVLSVERVQYDGRDMHRVKVVDDRGRVREYMQDSRSGGRRPTGSQRGDDNDD